MYNYNARGKVTFPYNLKFKYSVVAAYPTITSNDDYDELYGGK